MWYWFGLAALALVGEVNSGTFYLLLVALGFVGGGAAAAFGAGLAGQLASCALVALAGLLVLRRTGFLKKREINAASNADVNLDIGQSVYIDAWAENGTAQVRYRGATWQAKLAAGNARTTGRHVIIEIRGTRLIVAPRQNA